VALAWQAVPLPSTISKRLHARKRDADRIGIVAMRGKCLPQEMSLQTFDSLGSRTDPDATSIAANIARCTSAQPFKTTRAEPR
jgi:hypothetical protein